MEVKIRTNEELIQELKIECEKNGKMLTRRQIDANKNLASSGTYNTRIGGIEILKNLIGYDIISIKEENLKKLKIECNKVGRMLTVSEIDNNENLPTYSAYQKSIGGLKVLSELLIFELTEIQKRPDKNLIQDLKIECEKTGKMLTKREIDNNQNLMSATTYSTRFGNMEVLAELIGFEVINKTRIIDKDRDIIAELKNECKKMGRMLTKREINNNKILPGYSVYLKRFGSLYNIQEEVGFNIKVKEKRVKDKKTLLLELKIECEKTGRMLSSAEISDNNNLSHFATYSNHFSTIKDIAKAIDFEYVEYTPEPQKNKKELIKELKVECDKVNRMLSSKEINNNENLSCYSTYSKYIGNAIEIANTVGYEPHKGISLWELEVREFVEKIINNSIIFNDRTIIKPYELDIYIAELNKAIECNGNYWHSVEQKDSSYHINKTNFCLNKNIQLCHIWESEWEKNSGETKDYIIKFLTNKEIEYKNDDIIDRMKPLNYTNLKITKMIPPQKVLIDNYYIWNCGYYIGESKDENNRKM